MGKHPEPMASLSQGSQTYTHSQVTLNLWTMSETVGPGGNSFRHGENMQGRAQLGIKPGTFSPTTEPLCFTDSK